METEKQREEEVKPEKGNVSPLLSSK